MSVQEHQCWKHLDVASLQLPGTAARQEKQMANGQALPHTHPTEVLCEEQAEKVFKTRGTTDA